MFNTRFAKLVFVLLILSVLLAGCTATAENEGIDAATAAAIAAENERLHIEATEVAELATGTAIANQRATETAVVSTTTAQAKATENSEAATAEYRIASDSTATAVAQVTATAEQMALESTQTAVALAETRASLETAATIQATTEEMRNLVRAAKEYTPVFGPDTGELVHQIDESIEAKFANVKIQDFVAEVVFTMEPVDSPNETRDCGFQFRQQDENGWNLIVTNEGRWELVQQFGDEIRIAATGKLANSSLGASNKLTLYAKGAQGIFFINGQHVADLPLADWQAQGDISIGVEFLADNETDDETTQYKNFTIWPLEEIVEVVAPQPQPLAPVAAPAPVFDAQGFMNSLDEMRLIVEQMGGLLDRLYRGESQSCDEFMGYYFALQFRTPYTDLPTEWQGINNEYNFVADNILSTNTSIKTICEEGGGYLSDLDYGVARQGIGLSLDRINRAIQAGNQLSGG